MGGDDPDALTPGPTMLQALCDVIDVATRLTNTLAGDTVLQRLLEAFHLMPTADRPVIVSAIEREVNARRLSRATEEATGQSMYPNPHARLYLRSHEAAIPRNLLERDELRLATLNAMRVARILLVPEIHATWTEATRAAIAELDEATRVVVVGLMREALAMAEDPAPAAIPDDRTTRTG